MNSDATQGEVSPGSTSRQNSDLPADAHPSGGRIENMYRDVRPGEPQEVELLRPSERPNRYNPPEEPAEGSREDFDV